MNIYICPSCNQKSVMWDARAQVFLCHNPNCAISIAPPEESSQTEEAIVRLLSLNQLNVTQSWVNNSLKAKPCLR